MAPFMNEGTILGFAQVRRETDKAILVYLEDEGEERWIPKSVIHDNSEVYSLATSEGTLVVQTWWAEKEGLA